MRYAIEHPAFEWIMILSIIVSSVCLALDNPLNDPLSNLSKVLIRIDIALTSIFTAEAVGKIITFGLYECGSKSYLRNGWNVLDFFVVIITVRIYFLILSASFLFDWF